MSKYQILPELASDDFNRLKASILERGIKMPVVLDEDGEILDGHNRVQIADSLGIEYPRIVESGLDDHEKRIFVAELNAARRQLTDAQKVALGKRIEPDIAARAEKRRLASLKQGSESPPRSGQVSGTGETRDEVARAVQLGSGRTYERGKQVLEELASQPDGRQLLQHVESGDWTLDDARSELKTRRREAERKPPPTLMVSEETRQAVNRATEGMADEVVTLTMSQDCLRMSGRIKSYTSSLIKLPADYRQQVVSENPGMKTEYESLLSDALRLVGHLREMVDDQNTIRRVS